MFLEYRHASLYGRTNTYALYLRKYASIAEPYNSVGLPLISYTRKNEALSLTPLKAIPLERGESSALWPEEGAVGAAESSSAGISLRVRHLSLSLSLWQGQRNRRGLERGGPSLGGCPRPLSVPCFLQLGSGRMTWHRIPLRSSPHFQVLA